MLKLRILRRWRRCGLNWRKKKVRLVVLWWRICLAAKVTKRMRTKLQPFPSKLWFKSGWLGSHSFAESNERSVFDNFTGRWSFALKERTFIPPTVQTSGRTHRIQGSTQRVGIEGQRVQRRRIASKTNETTVGGRIIFAESFDREIWEIIGKIESSN